MRRHAAPPAASPPPVIDGVVDLARIGSGGFSVVYRGRESALRRDVAVKVLNNGITTEAERATFERECRALGALSAHPNIVTVYRPAFTADLRPCIVMELYQGNYRDRLDQRGPLPFEELLAVGVRIAGALHTTHRAGVLHRDLKPHNIFLSAYGEPALGDFGISTIDDERSHHHSEASGVSVAYAAPEVLEDSDASPVSDVYSLAASLYHLAAGTAPFASGDLRTTIRRILRDPVPPISRPDLPAGLDRALRTAMAKEPDDRPSSAMVFAEQLREVQARAGWTPTTIPTQATDLDPPSGGAADGAVVPGRSAPEGAGHGAAAPGGAMHWPPPTAGVSGVVPAPPAVGGVPGAAAPGADAGAGSGAATGTGAVAGAGAGAAAPGAGSGAGPVAGAGAGAPGAGSGAAAGAGAVARMGPGPVAGAGAGAPGAGSGAAAGAGAGAGAVARMGAGPGAGAGVGGVGAGAGMPPDGAAGDDPASVTVARVPRRDRAAAPSVPSPEPVGPRPSARRRWFAVGAVAVVLGLAAAGIAFLGGGSDDDSVAPTTVPATGPDDTFYDALPAPTAVTVTAAGEGRFRVDFDVVGAATAYELDPVNGPMEPLTVGADELPVTVEADATSLCVVVRSVGADGRISRPTDPVCAS